MGLLYFILEIVALISFVMFQVWAYSRAPWLFKAGAFAVLGALSFFGLRFMAALKSGAGLYDPIETMDVSSAANGIERMQAALNNMSGSLATAGPAMCVMMVIMCVAFHCAEILERKKQRQPKRNRTAPL